MLKKLTATGIIVAAATGFMLLGGTANADHLSVTPASHQATTYHPGDHGYGYGRGRWHHRNRWDRWNRWHHRNHGYGHRFHYHH